MKNNASKIFKKALIAGSFAGFIAATLSILAARFLNLESILVDGIIIGLTVGAVFAANLWIDNKF